MCLKLSVLFIFIYCGAFGQTPPATYGVVFSGSTTTTTTPRPIQSGCRCVAAGSCPTNLGIDVRIVNQGASASCAAGQVWCCGQPSGISTSCGIRKITDASAQPTGTARYGAYPWQVAILLPDNTYLGSGVLINDNHVLTVAHKVAPYPNLNFKLRLGDWDGQTTNEQYPYKEYNPVRVFIHPNYNSQNLFNDVAVIRLNGIVPLATSPNINTACLPTGAPVAGSRCYVAGWGKNSFGSSGTYQRVLKEVDVPIVDQNTCETRLRATRLGQYFILDRNSFMCAGGETGKDSCTGDGGAPLVCSSNSGQWTAVGLVGWGIGCADSTVPGVYVNIFNYLSWINQQLTAA
ncbi:hypothetical protein PV325_000837 [Microctonus aethiopoides]|uniref:Peptidase S1 domain-containing protein n=1 Tax=Microctonus aethiopoides TaxID=144406 RepID=A0AA39F0N9_9HYME|nr:hypothetical protein PV325_000837 [Microctonus aethiopoides]KAK0160140.1 hypothetical protein PV328_007577 [Microctonus aethiopoides]